jgi:hypothetical protein
LTVGKGLYDFANLVENQNVRFGVTSIKYKVELYDKFNVLLAERKGETFFNPQEKFVIYEPNIDTKNQVPDKAFIYFDDSAIWQRIKVVPPSLSIGTKNYTHIPQPRLQSKVTNNSLEIIRGTKFVAVLSDSEGNALAASQTIVDALAGNETKELNFTWPATLFKEPAIIDIYPKLNLFNRKYLVQ